MVSKIWERSGPRFGLGTWLTIRNTAILRMGYHAEFGFLH